MMKFSKTKIANKLLDDGEDYNVGDNNYPLDQSNVMDGDNANGEDEHDAFDIVEVKIGDSKFLAARAKKDSDFWATRCGFYRMLL